MRAWFLKCLLASVSVGLFACGQGAEQKTASTGSPTTTAVSTSAVTATAPVGSNSSAKDQRMLVVSSFSVLGDMVRAIAGERVQVMDLVGIDQDPHVYQPTPQDVQTLSHAQVFVSNGLNFEGWLTRMQANSDFKGVAVVATAGIAPLEAPQHGTEGHDHEHDHMSGVDPHAWQDPSLVRQYYVPNIVKGLSAADPAGAGYYQQRAQAYSAQLEQLSIQIHQILDRLPRAQRKAVVSHRAFEYFGKAYGVDFYSAQGMSTESQPSAKQVAQLIEQIKGQQIHALFVENISDPKMIEQISSETGVRVGGKLYSGALSSETEAYGATYLKMMQYNANQLFAAMR